MDGHRSSCHESDEIPGISNDYRPMLTMNISACVYLDPPDVTGVESPATIAATPASNAEKTKSQTRDPPYYFLLSQMKSQGVTRKDAPTEILIDLDIVREHWFLVLAIIVHTVYMSSHIICHTHFFSCLYIFHGLQFLLDLPYKCTYFVVCLVPNHTLLARLALERPSGAEMPGIPSKQEL